MCYGNNIGSAAMEEKSRKLSDSIAALQHEDYCRIWQLVKGGGLKNLEGVDRAVGQLMLEHPQYQYFWEIPHAFANIEREKAMEGEGVNPDAHLAVEASVLEQVETGDPPQAAKAYKALLEAGIEPHEARHTLARVVGELWLKVIRMHNKRQRLDADAYVRELERVAKHPVKVYNEQVKKIQKGL